MKTFILLLFPILAYSQSWETIESFYVKYDCNDCLDEAGRSIDYIYMLYKKSLSSGDYKIEFTDVRGDLYEIKNKDLYIKFTGYHGYAGYSQEGILRIDSYGNAMFTKTE